MKKRNNILKEAVVLMIVTLMVLSTISVTANADNKENTMLNNDPVLDLQFYQMDFNFDGTVYEDTDWGAVDLFFVGQEPIMYFNLAVNGEWQIQNIPVLSAQGVDVDQTMTYYFDLGNEVGEVVTDIVYGYEFTEDILQSKPDEFYTTPVEDDYVELWAGSEGEMPDLAEAKPLDGDEVSSTKKHAHENFPNQECGKKECAPAAVSNSLKFLNTKYKLGLTDEQTSINEMKEAVDFEEGKGSPLDKWWEEKKEYMEDEEYPITTRKITDMDKLIKEIDAGQDVEITESWIKNGKRTGHVTCLIGITKLKNGNYALDVVDDRKQGQAGGTNKPRTYIYNPKTGKIYEAGFGYTKFEYAVVECPKRPKFMFHFKDSDCPGGSLKVYGTHDCVRINPPIFDRYVKTCHKYYGYIPKKINDKEVNDVIFDFEWDDWCDNEEHTKWASTKYNGNEEKWELKSVYNWVEENINEELILHSIGDETGEVRNIYVIVNLDEYLANPVPPMDEYEIVDGECEDLPGYLIGTTPITFNPYAGPDEYPFSTTPLEYFVLTNDGEITLSPMPNQSPYTPEIDGLTSGKAGTEYEYTFVTTDPEDDDVYYCIDWDDGTPEVWIGPYESGMDATATHTWSSKGTYIIKAKANDTYGDESEWDYLEVTMPRNRLLANTLFMRLLERFPNIFPILRYILRI
ncbi:hypothetical protein MBGDF03_00089 [Thermoplasmatales archaeon SCGC AB-540-F20]|nr:hypothetical protein MBGDF03_00089 [Thermoplasmatales archaeon SCGC AB-540-F20]